MIKLTPLFLFVSTLFFIGSLNLQAKAQDVVVTVTGDITNPYTMNTAAFAAMKQITVTANSKDGKSHQYSGVSLYDMVTKAGTVPNEQLRGKALSKYVLITAADHYQVVIALPEFDPAFTDQIIILANQEDGHTLAAGTGPYRLIVPKDKRPARCVMQVTGIEVQTASPRKN